MSYDIVSKLLRMAGTDALPSGVFSEVLYDAVEKDGTPTSERVVAITAEVAEAKQVSFGKKRVHMEGALIIRMYEPDGKGDGAQIGHASTIALNLTNQKLSQEAVPGSLVTVEFGVATPLNSARTGPQWERTVRAPFRATFYLN